MDAGPAGECVVTLRMWCPAGIRPVSPVLLRSSEHAPGDRCADLIRDMLVNSPGAWDEVDSVRSAGCHADLFMGLFCDRPTVFHFPKSLWTELAAKSLELIFDFYPPASRAENERERSGSELIVEGPFEAVTRLRDRCPGLPDGRPVIWNPGATLPGDPAAIRLRFRSAHGQGAAVLDREAIELLSSLGAGVEVHLTG